MRIARLSKPITRYYYRYGYRRGYVLDQIKAQVNCRVIDYLGKKVIDLSIARRKLQFFAATVSVGSKKNLVIEADVSFNNELVISDRFIYIGNAYYFTYQDLCFLAIPLYPSLPYLKKRVLRLVYDRNYAEAWIRVKNEELNVSMNYMRNRSRSARLELSPLIDIELGFSFYNIELVKMDKTSSISRSFKLPVLEKNLCTHNTS